MLYVTLTIFIITSVQAKLQREINLSTKPVNKEVRNMGLKETGRIYNLETRKHYKQEEVRTVTTTSKRLTLNVKHKT
jgi:biopolymer transport protein ExbD